MTDCVFCRIGAGELPADVVRRNHRAVAFRDLNPQAPVHVLVIPAEHLTDVGELAGRPELLTDVVDLVREVAQAEGLAEAGYRVVFNTGTDGGQTVPHVHAHVLGGRAMGWPPG